MNLHLWVEGDVVIRRRSLPEKQARRGVALVRHAFFIAGGSCGHYGVIGRLP